MRERLLFDELMGGFAAHRHARIEGRNSTPRASVAGCWNEENTAIGTEEPE